MNKEEMIKNEWMQRSIRVAIFGTGFIYQKNKDKTQILVSTYNLGYWFLY